MCGENTFVAYGKNQSQGSPPRVRGKQERIKTCEGVCRITPACAGKTVRPLPWHHRARDHPRVCGENEVCRYGNCAGAGSPPRVRGKRQFVQRYRRNTGITPACAGKTSYTLVRVVIDKDHPRVCGENYVSPLYRENQQGSPPRVRGKP